VEEGDSRRKVWSLTVGGLSSLVLWTCLAMLVVLQETGVVARVVAALAGYAMWPLLVLSAYRYGTLGRIESD
jgi:hypothetical protein